MSADRFQPGEVVAVAPGVRRITAPNPGHMTGPGTNTYLIGEREIAVVDPGVSDAAHLDAIETAGNGRVTRILITHNHPDHSRGARELSARLDVPVFAHPTPLRGIREPDFAPDAYLDEGDRVVGADYRLRCLHTPGHAADHLCFLHEESGLLLAGDHVMEGVTVVIAPPDGDMGAYMASLERLRLEPITAFAPAHGGLLRPPGDVLDAVVAHRREREEQIQGVVAAHPDGIGIDDVVGMLYPDVPAPLRTMAAYQVYAHLLKLRAEGRVRGDDLASPWWVA